MKASTRPYLELCQFVHGVQKYVHVFPGEFLRIHLQLLVEVVQIHVAHVHLPSILFNAQDKVVRQALVVVALIVVLNALVLESHVPQTDDQECCLALICIGFRLNDRLGEIASTTRQVFPVDEALDLGRSFAVRVRNQQSDQSSGPGALCRLMLLDTA